MQFNVYKIECDTTGLVYYGSTKDTLNRRLSKHKSSCKRYLEGTIKKYCTSYEVIKNNNYKITLLETCFHVPHMIERETYYKEHNDCVNLLTPAVPGRTNKEYREKNKEYIAEYWKEYYETYKEKRKEKYTCECGSTLRKADKHRHERTIKHQNYLKNLNNTLNK